MLRLPFLSRLRSLRIVNSIRSLPPMVLLALIALVPRLVNLGGENLWYDESFTAWIAKLPNMGAVLSAARADVHPPGYYLLEWVNVRIFGSSEAALRLPSALFGVLAVLMVFQLARTMGLHKQVAFNAGLIAAFLPGALYYSQEARGYAFLCVVVIGMVIAAMRRNWPVFVICGAAASYTHNLGLFYVATVGVWACVSQGAHWKHYLKPYVAIGAIIASWSPWLPSLLQQMTNVNSGFWLSPTDLGQVLTPLATMSLGWRMHEWFTILFWPTSFAVTFASVLVARKLLLTSRGRVLAVGIVGAPVLAALYGAFSGHSIYLARAFLPSVMMIIPLWVYAMDTVKRPNRRLLKLALAPALAIGMVAQYFPGENGKLSMANLLEPITANWQSGDVMYYPQISPAIISTYYLPGKPYIMATDAGDLNQMISDQGKRDFGFNLGTWADVQAHYHRAWIVLLNNGMTTGAVMQFREYLARNGQLMNIENRANVASAEIWRIDL